MCVVEDMFAAMGKTEEERKKAMAGPLPFFIERLVRLMNENPSKSGWFVGDKLTVADIKFHALILLVDSGMMDHIDRSFYANVPEVAAHKAKIEEYVASKGLSFD